MMAHAAIVNHHRDLANHSPDTLLDVCVDLECVILRMKQPRGNIPVE